MSTITIYGFPQSTYVRSARMVCEEKGVDYRIDDSIEMGSETYRELHPFNKIPAMRHGDFVLYETAAIGRYIDEAFDGPALQPKDVKARASMEQWISAINDYCYQVIILELVFPRVVIPMRGGEPDENMIEAAIPKIDHQLGVFDKTLARADYLAGPGVSLADLLLLPILFYVKNTPEGGAAMDKVPAVGAWFERMAGRPSFAATLPPMPEAAE
ncbi:MAG: glutathione S-transferase family protein [Pseudomonadota bacterium]